MSGGRIWGVPGGWMGGRGRGLGMFDFSFFLRGKGERGGTG